MTTSKKGRDSKKKMSNKSNLSKKEEKEVGGEILTQKKLGMSESFFISHLVSEKKKNLWILFDNVFWQFFLICPEKKRHGWLCDLHKQKFTNKM